MTLKTLKDLMKENDDELSFGGYTSDILREEAKKWVKYLNSKLPEVIGRMPEHEAVSRSYIYGQIKILKDFFNLEDK